MASSSLADEGIVSQVCYYPGFSVYSKMGVSPETAWKTFPDPAQPERMSGAYEERITREGQGAEEPAPIRPLSFIFCAFTPPPPP